MLKRIITLLLTLCLLLPAACAEEPTPRVQFYLTDYIFYLDRDASVIVQCNNPASIAGGQTFQLRDHEGRVLSEAQWKNPGKRLSFKFRTDAAMLGGSELSVWWNGVCVSSDVAYMAVSDSSLKCVTQLEPATPAIALTVVCGGGSTRNMDDIFAVLDKHGVKATFFINGGYLNAHLEDARRIVPAGHELASHGFLHENMTEMDNYRRMRNIITRMNEECEALLGVRPRLFRAPYSYTNAKVTALVRAEGMEDVKWNIDSQDWSDKYRNNPAGMVRRVTGDKCVSGSVIQFHLDGNHTAEVLDQCIPLWRAMGYQVLTVSELMALSGREIPEMPERVLGK